MARIGLFGCVLSEENISDEAKNLKRKSRENAVSLSGKGKNTKITLGAPIFVAY